MPQEGLSTLSGGASPLSARLRPAGRPRARAEQRRGQTCHHPAAGPRRPACHEPPLPSVKRCFDLLLECQIPLKPSLLMPSFHVKPIYVTLIAALASELANTRTPHELVTSRKQAAFQNEHTSSLSSPQCFHVLQNYTRQPKASFQPAAETQTGNGERKYI